MVQSLLLLAMLAAACSASFDVQIEAGTAAAAQVAHAASKVAQAARKSKKTHRLPVNRNYNKKNAFIMPIDLGRKKQRFNAVVDLGSSNLWVGCTGPTFTPQGNTTKTNLDLSIAYSSNGQAFGPAVIDQAKFGTGMVVQNKTFSLVNSSDCSGLSIGGVVGFGPIDLSNSFVTTNGTGAPDVFETPVLDLAQKQKVIKQRLLGVSFQPSSTNKTLRNGLLTFGGVNKKLFIGDLDFVPRTKTFPASLYWGVDLRMDTVKDNGQIFHLSNLTSAANATRGLGFTAVIDSGTTVLSVTQSIYDGYVKAINATVSFDASKATGDIDSTLPSIAVKDVAKIKPITFHIGKHPYVLSADNLLAPQAQVANADSSKRYLLLNAYQPTTPNVPVILGLSVLERMYIALDTDSNRIGFAYTKFSAKPIPQKKHKSKHNRRQFIH